MTNKNKKQISKHKLIERFENYDLKTNLPETAKPDHNIYRHEFDPLELKEMELYAFIDKSLIRKRIAPRVVVLDCAAKTWGVKAHEITSKSQVRECVYARYFCMLYTFYNQPPNRISMAKIGQMYGGKDHAMIHHARKLNKNFFEINDEKWVPKIKEFVNRILTYNPKFRVEMEDKMDKYLREMKNQNKK